MRIVTWNMGCGPRSRYRKLHDEAWAYLREELKPDVALVQEALVDKLREVGRECDVTLCDLASDKVEAGTAVVVRCAGVAPGPLLRVSPSTYMPTTSVLTSEGPIVFASVHVYPGEQLHADLARIVTLLETILSGGPAIVGGDFNSARRFGGRHKKFFAAVKAAGFHDTHWGIHGREVQSFFTRGEVQDDHVFVSAAWDTKVISCDIIDNAVVRLLSDHGPVVLELDVATSVQPADPILTRLLEVAAKELPGSLASEAVVFGSAPMVLAGLRDKANDLDLFVSEDTFVALVDAGCTLDTTRPNVPRIRVAEDVEVFKTWPGVTFEEVFRDARPVPGSCGLRVAGLRHVLAGKLASNRQKDQPDIAALRRALGHEVDPQRR